MARHPNPHLPWESWGPGAGLPFIPPDPAPVLAPVNKDVPYAWAEVSLASCTMGNWTGAPTSYAYQWKRDGTNIAGGTAADYPIVAADAGHTLTCVVTATNSKGSTAAPPSNPVPVAAALATLVTDPAPEAVPEAAPKPKSKLKSEPEPEPEPEPDPKPARDAKARK